MRALSLFVVWLATFSGAAAHSAESGVAARVNGKVIASQDVQKVAERIAKGAGTDPDRVWNDALQQMVTLELLGQAAKAEGITVSKAEVEEEFNSLKTQMGGVQNILAGASEAEFRVELQRSLIIDKLLEKHIKVKVTDEDVAKFYAENKDEFERPPMVRASHILIRIQGKDADAARKQAEAIRIRAKKGEDFAKLATETSQDPGTAKRGGDLGFFPERSTPVAEAAFKLKPGEISDIVESPYGLHIIKVTDTRPLGIAPLNEVSEEIQSLLEDEQREEQEDAFIADLTKKAKIELLQQKTAAKQS